MSPIRILIAEDHAMLADALQMLLSSQPDMHCVGVAPSGQEAVELAAHLQPDILLLDLGMPGLDGL